VIKLFYVLINIKKNGYSYVNKTNSTYMNFKQDD